MYRRGLLLPLLLIVIGVVALLANLGLLDPRVILRLINLWPLFLVLIGIELIITRTLPRTLVPIVSLLVLLAVVALAIIYVFSAPLGGFAGTQQSAASDRIEGLSTANLDLDFGASSVDLRGASLGEDLYRARFEFPTGEQPPVVRLDRSSSTLHIQHQERPPRFTFGFSPMHDRVDLSLSDRVPWIVAIRGGAVDSALDLTGLEISRLQLSGGASRSDIRMRDPKATVSVDISGGAADITLHIPSGSAWQVKVTGGASDLEVDGAHYGGFGDKSQQSDGYAQATDRFDIRASGGATHIRLLTRASKPGSADRAP